MISANEAREKTGKINSKDEQKLEEIEFAIEEAIEKGYYCVTLDGVISPAVVNHLRRLGYEVQISDLYNDYFTIKW